MTNTLTLAIDPGASGGYAYKLSDSGQVVAGSLPETDGDLIDLLKELDKQADDRVLHIEDVASHTGDLMMASAMSKLFGQKRYIEGLAQGTGWKVVNVAPKKWQAFFSFGKKLKRTTKKGKLVNDETEWKNRLKSEAQKRFPSIKVTLPNSDALLILEHALSK